MDKDAGGGSLSVHCAIQLLCGPNGTIFGVQRLPALARTELKAAGHSSASMLQYCGPRTMRKLDGAPRLLDNVTYRRLCRAKDFLAANYRERVRLQDAARTACLSPWHFHRLYSLAFRETPHEFLTRLRIDEAKRRLAISSDSATDICLDLGYESLGTFSSRFRNLVGCSPREYRRRTRRIFLVPSGWYLAVIPFCFVEFFGVLREPQDRRRNSPLVLAS